MDAPLIDPFARTIRYLRVSVTDRCDFRCTYCMTEHMTFLPRAELLTLEELARLCTAFIDLGVRKLRITGGEPLVRRGLMGFLQTISEQSGPDRLNELTLTTNGSQLGRFAAELAGCGIRRINVSLDTLDAAKFARITRWGRLPQVLDGIAAAQAAGIRIKINCVALRGVNEDELFTLTEWCAREGHDLTFIEVMPMGDFESAQRLGQYWNLRDLRAQLATRYQLTDTSEQTGGPARYVRIGETGQRIGFITPLSHNFCESCNRVRLSCTGELFPCLGQEGASDLRAVLRSGVSEAGLKQAIRAAITRKPRGHDFDYSPGQTASGHTVPRLGGQMSRFMSHTGG